MDALVDLLAARGGRLERIGPRPAVASFGDGAAEARALGTGAGLLARPGWAQVSARGADAHSFLHRLLSQDLARLLPGRARHACLLTREGKVLADPVVWRFEDRLRLAMDPRAAAKGMPLLARHVIADDVVFEDGPAGGALLALAGPRAADALAALGVPAPAAGAFAPFPCGAGEAHVLRRDLGDRPAFEVLVDEVAAVPACARLLAAPGVVLVGEEAFDALRVEAGVAAYGAEIDDTVLPNEAGLEDALSFTKGCYLGQEPVTMARHRGHPPTLLARLVLGGDAVPAPGSTLSRDGRPAGRLTTVARGATRPDLLALALVRHADARPGVALVADATGAPATVDAVLAR